MILEYTDSWIQMLTSENLFVFLFFNILQYILYIFNIYIQYIEVY